MKIRTLFRSATLLAATFMGVNSLQADVTLPKIFSDDMVLQRDQQVPVWGWAEPGEAVTVKFDGQSVKAKADADGKWRVDLEPLKVGKARTLTVKGNNTITLKNVLVGEVWLCSGQSNMEWGIGQLANAKEEIANAKYPNLRLMFVPKAASAVPNKELPKNCQWRVCTPENVVKGTHKGGFSGTAYYYGRELHKKLGVPVGLIQSCWGGTRIEPWTTVDGFKSVPALKKIYNQVSKAGKAKKKVGRQTPTVLYNAMIHPLVPFAIKGTIWYQGEANRNDGLLYCEKMKALIQGWRKLWNNEQMPFYFVQLAPYKYKEENALPVMWEAQTKAMQQIPHTGMAIINDIGNLTNIHPTNKQDVGKRLALWSLKKSYNQDIDVYSGPIYKSHKIEGAKVRISFDHTGSGLAARDSKALSWFEIAGADNKFIKADAVIEGSEVVVSSATVTEPVSVRFAWGNQAVPNLINKDGLPASGFRIGYKGAEEAPKQKKRRKKKKRN